MAYHKEEKKKIDTTEVVKYLSRSFNRAIYNSPLGGTKALRTVNNRVDPTDLYLIQVDFAHMLDNIMRGPKYIAPKYIQEANELIASIEA